MKYSKIKQFMDKNKFSVNSTNNHIRTYSLIGLIPVAGMHGFAESSISLAPLPMVSTDGSEFSTILSILFATLGAICLLVVVIAGFRYIISRGDPQQIARSKDTIIYALVGLVIAVLAFTIVDFVLGHL